jgi:hypothetical protein
MTYTDERMILKCNFGKCEHGNEPSGFIKGWGYLNYLTYYQLLKLMGRKTNIGVSGHKSAGPQRPR